MQFVHGQLVRVPSAPPEPPEPHAPQSFGQIAHASSPLHAPSPHLGGCGSAGKVTDDIGDARLCVAASDCELSSGGRLPATDGGPLHADNKHAAKMRIAPGPSCSIKRFCSGSPLGALSSVPLIDPM